MSDEAAGRIIPNAFLDKVKAEFEAKYGDKGRAAQEAGACAGFGKRLKELMEHCTQFPEEYSKVASVQKRVDEVKNIMSENIEKVRVVRVCVRCVDVLMRVRDARARRPAAPLLTHTPKTHTHNKKNPHARRCSAAARSSTR